MTSGETWQSSELVPMHELEKLYQTTDALQTRFGEIYGGRNEIYLKSHMERVLFFMKASGDLFETLRATNDSERLKVPVARMVSRIFCIANSISDVQLSEGLMVKFPYGKGCVYCHAAPCQCSQDNKAVAELGMTYEGDQRQWSLRQWQGYLGSLYNEPNRQRGVWFAATRLTHETLELVDGIEQIPLRTPAEVRWHARLEVADAFAWTAAVANLVGVDVQQAVLERYGNGCSACAGVPCQCSQHNRQQVTF
jgi:hypothetical protein